MAKNVALTVINSIQADRSYSKSSFSELLLTNLSAVNIVENQRK